MHKKQSVEQYVYETLKSAILSRDLAPGTQLVETMISNQLNVSRTPIRNAITKLKKSDLVEVFPNKGAYVTNPSRQEILQAYDLRKQLEILAAIKAIDYLTSSDFEKMEKYIEEEKNALNKKNLNGYLEANQNFHMTIAQKTGNKFLIEFIDKLINKTNIYLILFDSFFENTATSPIGPKEHKEIVLHLKKKNSEKLNDILNQHFNNAINSLSLYEENEYKGIDKIF